VVFPSFSVGHTASLWYPDARATRTPTVPQLPGRLVAYCTGAAGCRMLGQQKKACRRALQSLHTIRNSAGNCRRNLNMMESKRYEKAISSIKNRYRSCRTSSSDKLSSLCWAQKGEHTGLHVGKGCMAQNHDPM
jgi:hypothetical protein